MAPFDYDPFNLEGSSFRLVRLLKGESGLIECELFNASLCDTDDIVGYEALSYTRGGSDKPHEIEIEGKSMPVTLNLSQALWRLRDPCVDRILWIDAIYIDQNNFKERGHQVKQMTSIYKRADQVLIWLGEATAETDIIFYYMQQLREEALKEARVDWTASDHRWQDLWSTLKPPQGGVDRRDLDQHIGLYNLLNRPWFERVWIIQEVANARSARVICGVETVSARIFAITPPLVGITPDQHCQAILDIMPGP